MGYWKQLKFQTISGMIENAHFIPPTVANFYAKDLLSKVLLVFAINNGF